jgi:D-beta-D-heptose 7-phosphate kinase/D-beta-D-heptose 1-phosphate adenosyltransferase
MTSLKKTDLQKFLNKIKKVNILLLGDLMLDTFEYGTITRKSPEADVPLILLKEILKMPGGAGNVALNIKHVGGQVKLVSEIGNDLEGQDIIKVLQKEKVNTKYLIKSKKVTISKKRILVDGKHFARIDKEDLFFSDKKVEKQVLEIIKKEINKTDIVIFSDYCKGFLTKELVSKAAKLIRAKNIPILVDTKPANANFYKDLKISYITPNVKEALEISGEHDEIKAALKINKTFSTSTLLTQSERGMTLFYEDQTFHQDVLENKIIVDVSGCGDTVLSFFALALGAKYSPSEAVIFANYAANIVVQKKGTATISKKEFLNYKIKNHER